MICLETFFLQYPSLSLRICVTKHSYQGKSCSYLKVFSLACYRDEGQGTNVPKEKTKPLSPKEGVSQVHSMCACEGVCLYVSLHVSTCISMCV